MSFTEDREEEARFAQFTPEQILASYLAGFENGDFNILDDLTSAMHQEVALALIKAGKSKLLLDNFYKFRDLKREQILEEILRSSENMLAQEYSYHFPDVDPEEINKFLDNI